MGTMKNEKPLRKWKDWVASDNVRFLMSEIEAAMHAYGWDMYGVWTNAKSLDLIAKHLRTHLRRGDYDSVFILLHMPQTFETLEGLREFLFYPTVMTRARARMEEYYADPFATVTVPGRPYPRLSPNGLDDLRLGQS
jgi:hypothetical protein